MLETALEMQQSGEMKETAEMKNLHRLFTVGPLHGPADVAGFAIWKLSMAYQRRAEAALREMGLTHTQFAVLCLTAWLLDTRGSVNHGDVARLSGAQVAQVSLMIKALRAKQLVNQCTGPEDTRVRFLTITPAGITLLAKAIPMMSCLQEELWPAKSELPDLLQTIHTTLGRWEESDV